MTVQVDGGITEETIRVLRRQAPAFVAGSSVYGVDEALGGRRRPSPPLRCGGRIGQALWHRFNGCWRYSPISVYASNGAGIYKTPHL